MDAIKPNMKALFEWKSDCKFYQAYNARIIVQNVIQSHNQSLKMLLDRKKKN